MKVGWYHLWKNKFAVKGILPMFHFDTRSTIFFCSSSYFSLKEVHKFAYKTVLSYSPHRIFHNILAVLSWNIFHKTELVRPFCKTNIYFSDSFYAWKHPSPTYSIRKIHAQIIIKIQTILSILLFFLLQIGKGWIRDCWHQDTKVALFLNY